MPGRITRSRRRNYDEHARRTKVVGRCGAGATRSWHSIGVCAEPSGTGRRAAATERIVTDWHTRLALYGFDPVAYFADAAPSVGNAELEYSYGGWSGASVTREIGRRGYDPIAVGRGAPTPGHPQLWLIVRERLLLFRDIGSRAAFATDPAQAIADAQAQWSAMMKERTP